MMNSWEKNLEVIREDLKTQDFEIFLRWPVIQQTMFVGNCDYIDREYKYITEHKLWNTMFKNIEDIMYGNPAVYTYNTKLSGNYIHAIYHIAMFLERMGYNRINVDSIFEFGGGYGAMANVLTYCSNFKDYTLFDFPEFLQIQKKYIDKTSNSKSLYTYKSNIDDIQILPDTMFISTWAISETPLDFRGKIIEHVKDCKYILIAYAAEFDGINNVEYFKKWEEWEHFSWVHIDIPTMDSNHKYLFGRNFYE